MDEPTVVDWHGLHVALPVPWEVVRHGVSPLKGSLVFADRTRQRLQVTWTACRKAPDVDRLLSDHRAKQLKANEKAVFDEAEPAEGWRGLVRRFEDGRAITRLARYEAGAAGGSKLVEVVLEHRPGDRAEAELLPTILAGFDAEGEVGRYRIFGLDVKVEGAEGGAEAGERPAPLGKVLRGGRWWLGSTRVLPADVTLTFQDTDPATHKEAKATVAVRRQGMADGWFDGDLEKLIKRELPKAKWEFEEDEVNGHGAVVGRCVVPGPRIKRFARLHNARVEVAWQCEEENAVYRVAATGPARRGVEVAGFVVRCHGVLGEEG